MEGRLNVFDAIEKNKRNTLFLIFGMLLILLFTSFFFIFYFNLGIVWYLFAFILSLLYIFTVLRLSDKIILLTANAKELDRNNYGYVYNLVEGLAIAANIPTPKIYVSKDGGMNAFAVGRNPNNSAIVFTSGLLKKLNKDEIAAVAAHEISHIANRDTEFMITAVIMVGLVSIFSDTLLRAMFRERRIRSPLLFLFGIVLAIISPFIAEIVRFAISREREYLADATAVKLTRYPPALISALRKISSNSNVKTATRTTAPLYIENPLKGHIISLFSTHPPVEERIKRLERM